MRSAIAATLVALVLILVIAEEAEVEPTGAEPRAIAPTNVHRAEQIEAAEKAARERRAKRERRKARAAERAQAEAVASATPVEEPDYTEPAPASGGGFAGPDTVQCESGGDYGINTGNGYYGAYQFDSQTWDAYGDPAYAEAHLAPPAVQDAAAAAVPYDAWPNC